MSKIIECLLFILSLETIIRDGFCETKQVDGNNKKGVTIAPSLVNI